MLGWLRAGRVAGALLVVTLAYTSLCGAAVRPGDDEFAITCYMQTLYQDALDKMRAEGIPEEGTKVTVADGTIMYEYSDDGLRPLPLAGDEAQGASAGAVEPSEPDGVLYPEGSIKPVRKVVSKTGYFRAEGSVRLPGASELWGVDASEGYDEGAFNYFGVAGPRNNVEIGVCTRAFQGGYSGGEYHDPTTTGDGSSFITARAMAARISGRACGPQEAWPQGRPCSSASCATRTKSSAMHPPVATGTSTTTSTPPGWTLGGRTSSFAGVRRWSWAAGPGG